MTNGVSNFQEELKELFSNKFFFRKPSDSKVIIYILFYFIFLLVGIYLNFWVATTFFTVYLLAYTLGAKGVIPFLSVGVLGTLITFNLGNIYISFWTMLHVLIAGIIYFAITKRYSKILLVTTITSFIFFAISIFIAILIKQNIISLNAHNIQTFINDYISDVMQLQKSSTLTTDEEILRRSFEEIKVYVPMILFSNIFIYTLLLVQITLKTLSAEKVITPVFPPFSKVVVASPVATVYVLLTLISYLLMIDSSYNRYSIENLFLENLIAIMRWLFVFNGLFTCYYFIEHKKGNDAKILKIFLLIPMIIFSFIFELIGLIDSVMKIRAYHSRNKGGM